MSATSPAFSAEFQRLLQECEALETEITTIVQAKSNSLEGPQRIHHLRLCHIVAMQRQIKVLKQMVAVLSGQTQLEDTHVF